jgi:putative restriction endonuclease
VHRAGCWVEEEGDGIDYPFCTTCSRVSSDETVALIGFSMTKAIFTTRVTPSYDDQPERYYHFPSRYLNQVRAAVGDQIIYYEPRRVDSSLSSKGGRQAYFASAQVTGIRDHATLPNHYYAEIASFLQFPRPVPFREGARYYESRLKSESEGTNLGVAQRAVRSISDSDFDLILRAGYAPILEEKQPPSISARNEVDEPQVEYQRPIVEMTILRPFRDRAFKFAVRAAYDNCCAFTGLRLINGGGRPEVEAAHIRPVADDGPDTVRNGLALSGTAHWMFDRGLVSIGDGYEILIAKNRVPENALRLLNETRTVNLPKDPTLHPNAHYLRFHRDTIFKG